MAVAVMVPGVEPLAGEMLNQFPVLVAAAADQFSVEALLVTAMGCVAGTAPPKVWVNERVGGVTPRVPAFTVKVTGMVIGLSATAPPLVVVAVMVMLPV